MIPHELCQLSPRQREVLDLICQGLPAQLIGQKLGLPTNMIVECRHALLQQFGAANAVELVNTVNQIKSAIRLGQQPEMLAKLSTPPRLLVVEDDAPYRELLVDQLKRSGFLNAGVDCRAAMEVALVEHPVNIVLLDLNLGKEDGLVIARNLRETFPALGIIMMTTRGMVEQRIDELLGVADVYLVKPVDLRELVGVVRNLHRRKVEVQFGLTGQSGMTEANAAR